ncbi:MAG: DinB family protein [Phycisphaerales bacterium]
MLDTLRQLLISQYHAALSTLASCVAHCPDSLWNAPIAKAPFSQAAFHTLIFADLYLGRDDETAFRRQPFHLAHPEFFGDYEQLEYREPVCVYQRAPIMKYIEFVRDKAAATLAAESAESLSGPCGLPRRLFSRAELHVYNIRHIQHHSAQLILRLRIEHAADIRWFGAGWTDPPDPPAPPSS